MSRVTSKFINFGTGADQVNSRLIPANFTPIVYTPTQVATEGTAQISAHLNGIDQLLRLFDITRSVFIREDWLSGAGVGGVNGFVAQVAGTAAAIASVTTNQDASRMGIIQLTSGTTATGRASVGTTVLTLQHGGGVEDIEWAIFTPTLPSAAQDFTLRVGTGSSGNAAGDNVHGVYFEINRAVSATNWIIKTAQASTRSSTTTSVVFIANVWISLRIIITGSSAEFFINGTSVGTIATNVPTTVGNYVAPMCKIEKTAGTTARTVSADLFSYKKTFSGTR